MNKEILKLKEEIACCIARLLKIQGECSHSDSTKIAKADTGNYCKSDDSYWYDIQCNDCGKQWAESQ